MKIHKIDTTINSILLSHCDITGSTLDQTIKNCCFDATINSILLLHGDTKHVLTQTTAIKLT